jgi:hypothetical protein
MKINATELSYMTALELVHRYGYHAECSNGQTRLVK